MFSEALDKSNNKKAVQEAEKALKKQPDLGCASALMGLALVRQGRKKDANIVLNKLMEDVPVDESTLQAMTMAFKEMLQRKNGFFDPHCQPKSRLVRPVDQ